MQHKSLDLGRWKQGHLRKLILELLDQLDWEGKTQPEILEMARGIFTELLFGLYDWVSTMFSRFLRTISGPDPDTGRRVRTVWRDSQGRYWRLETLKKNPVLMADCLKTKQQGLEEDVNAHNQFATDVERVMGKPFPRARVFYEQLQMGLFPPRSDDPEA